MNDLIKKMLKIYDIECNTEEDLLNISLDLDILRNPEKINELNSLIPLAKENNYNSNSLTCLHKNSLQKQKFPAINFLRQILKCNKYKLKGYYISIGYNKVTGKKILKRLYKVILLE